MADHTDQMISIRDCRIRLMRGGTGAPLLFLHGGGGAGIWLPSMAALAKKFDVIAPEHPGFGASDTPPWLDNVADLAYFYLDFLEQLDLRGVHLVGSSLGGWIAAELAVRNSTPSRVADADRLRRHLCRRTSSRSTRSCAPKSSASATCSTIRTSPRR